MSTERKQPRREITYGERGFLIGEGNSASVSAAFVLFCAQVQLHAPFAVLLLSDLSSENHSFQVFWKEKLLATTAGLSPLLAQISVAPAVKKINSISQR